MRPTVFVAVVAITTAACHDGPATSLRDQDAPPPQIAAGDVRVALQKTSFTRDEASVATGAGVRGTITNTSDRTLFAKLGDAFNSAAEQDPVYVAVGSDGMLERLEGSSWVGVTSAHLVEGVRAIELRPGKAYTFVAHASSAITAGTYRVTIAYRASANASAASGTVSSPTFAIQ